MKQRDLHSRAQRVVCELVLILCGVLSSAQPGGALTPTGFLGADRPGLGGNDTGDMVWSDGKLYVASGGFLSKLIGEGQNASDWVSYDLELGEEEEGISALWVQGDTIWVATSYATTYQGEEIPAGNGLRLSVDGGLTWRHFQTQELFLDRAAFSFPDNYTTCYDIASVGDTMWFSFTAGFAVKTEDLGETWAPILPGTSGFVFTDPNHHANSLVTCGDTLWVGTFGGIHRSTDGGNTWIRYDRESTGGQIPGNFIPALAVQRLQEDTLLWAGAKPFGQGEREGVTRSPDGGATWILTTLDRSAWNFAFRDTVAWATTDDGLFRTDDFGDSWAHVPIEDPIARERMNKDVVGIASVGDTLWVGSNKGLAGSTDQGATWTILSAPVQTRSLDEGRYVDEMTRADSTSTVRTYAYRNPFSPAQHEVVRIQYSLSQPAQVTIRIFDFASRPVRTLIQDAPRTGPENHGENWEGENDDGSAVANGVYFYRIETDRGDQGFGKIVVLE
ncbi:MAG: hypothetical protein V1800_05505 [Candidatus Latescibacterota bacterium]